MSPVFTERIIEITVVKVCTRILRICKCHGLSRTKSLQIKRLKITMYDPEYV